MKTKIVSITLLFISLFTINGFMLNGTKAVQANKNPESSFTGIILKTFANIYITQGSKTEARIETENNISHNILMETKNDKLIIYSNEEIKKENPASIYITLKDLTYLELSGSGSISTNELIKCDVINLLNSSSGNINISLESKSLKVNLSGSGDVTLRGNTPELEIEISGSGNVDGKEFKTFSSSINISGSGTGIIDVEDNLVVEITGSGNVYYISDPERIQATSRGSGRIEKVKA